ncbi:J domain-containing protein [Luteipulveratus flavus]|uniref:J domain-containing protein n=1 Tax=Luteipulveratus flavus TaxID=3031728 RepID=A0ABT6C8A4_9MICO|nr:J domain-containing protein [Luteipulveratus sp. YIM 133296]MDF8265169.1 J domain-containing protein [Luteipulveratus sp. YIM 133296]
MTHYDVLGVAPDATESELRQAYRRQMRDAHPDRDGGDVVRTQELHRAWEALGTPGSRRAYDDGLSARAVHADPDPVEESVLPEDDWGEEVGDDAFTARDDVIVDGSPEIVDDWGGHRPQEAAWPQGPPMPTHTWSQPGGAYGAPLPRLGRPRGWALLPLGLLIAYTIGEIVGESILNSDWSSLSSGMFLVPVWVIGYTVARTRALSARITKGYVIFAAVIFKVGVLFLLVDGGWVMTVMASIWVVLYVWTVEAWARQVARNAAR